MISDAEKYLYYLWETEGITWEQMSTFQRNVYDNHLPGIHKSDADIEVEKFREWLDTKTWDYLSKGIELLNHRYEKIMMKSEEYLRELAIDELTEYQKARYWELKRNEERMEENIKRFQAEEDRKKAAEEKRAKEEEASYTFTSHIGNVSSISPDWVNYVALGEAILDKDALNSIGRVVKQFLLGNSQKSHFIIDMQLEKSISGDLIIMLNNVHLVRDIEEVRHAKSD